MDETNKFIPVVAKFDVNGNITPLAIDWNGHVVGIDKVLEARTAASLKHGGFGKRWTVRIRSTRCYIFCDGGRWWLERT